MYIYRTGIKVVFEETVRQVYSQGVVDPQDSDNISVEKSSFVGNLGQLIIPFRLHRSVKEMQWNKNSG